MTRVAFVDARDLGEVAARALREPAAHTGRAYHLTGAEALSFDEVAAIVTRVLGRPVRYEPVGLRRYVAHLRAQRLPAGRIAVQAVLHLDLRRGTAEPVTPTLGGLLGRPPTSFERFVADHADAWR